MNRENKTTDIFTKWENQPVTITEPTESTLRWLEENAEDYKNDDWYKELFSE